MCFRPRSFLLYTRTLIDRNRFVCCVFLLDVLSANRPKPLGSHGLCPVFYNFAFKHRYMAVKKSKACNLPINKRDLISLPAVGIRMGYMQTITNATVNDVNLYVVTKPESPYVWCCWGDWTVVGVLCLFSGAHFFFRVFWTFFFVFSVSSFTQCHFSCPICRRLSTDKSHFYIYTHGHLFTGSVYCPIRLLGVGSIKENVQITWWF